MIRLPLIITEAEKPPTKGWSAVIGKGLVCLAVLLFLVYVLAPLLEQQ